MGIHWTGIVFGLGAVISFGYWTTDFLVVQRVLSAKDLRAAKMAPIIGAAFKMFVPFIVILPVWFAKSPQAPESRPRNNVTGLSADYSFQTYFEFWRRTGVDNGASLSYHGRVNYQGRDN
jgi:hypothetical protein